MSQNQDNFFDSKTLLAIVSVFFVWMGWQWYMQQKYPPQEVKKPLSSQAKLTTPETAQKQDFAGDKAKHGDFDSNKLAKSDELGELQEAVVEETSLAYENGVFSFEISNRGMGIKNLRLKQYSDREQSPISLGTEGEQLPLETNIVGRRQPLFFNVEKPEDNVFVGTAQVNGIEIVKTIIVDSKNYSLDTRISVSGNSNVFAGLTNYLVERVRPSDGGSFLFAQFEHQEFFVDYEDSEERVMIKTDEGINENFSKVDLAAISSQYFSLAVLNRSDVLPEYKIWTDPDSTTAYGMLVYNVLNPGSEFNVRFLAYAGPKKLDLLNSINARLTGLIDYGMFSAIGTWILKLMRLFNSWVGNWGIAIILLTILVRILVLPLYLISFKSMAKMQKIQPLIKQLREKHKEDPQKLNQEMMTLMKENKVNPMGGCLPMLLQFPVFIALYQVLGQSIELYKSPFVLWIHDLSSKDPYYVLPVLMGLTLFIQTKITPSTMEPAQQKIMLIMPVVFSVFMISLPSGLTLYIFISGLFGLIQHFIFMREKNKSPANA